MIAGFDPSVALGLLQNAPDIGWRLDAPFRFRLIVQPLVALLLGLRDGRLDAKTGTPPYLYELIFVPALRQARLKSGLTAIAKPLAVAVIIDAVVQFTFLDSLNILAALLIGALLIAWGCFATTIQLVRGARTRQMSGYTSLRLRLGRFLALGLEFQLAADILSTAISPSWEELGK